MYILQQIEDYREMKTVGQELPSPGIERLSHGIINPIFGWESLVNEGKAVKIYL
jgi:hypothetical protein